MAHSRNDKIATVYLLVEVERGETSAEEEQSGDDHRERERGRDLVRERSSGEMNRE